MVIWGYGGKAVAFEGNRILGHDVKDGGEELDGRSTLDIHSKARHAVSRASPDPK